MPVADRTSSKVEDRDEESPMGLCATQPHLESSRSSIASSALNAPAKAPAAASPNGDGVTARHDDDDNEAHAATVAQVVGAAARDDDGATLAKTTSSPVAPLVQQEGVVGHVDEAALEAHRTYRSKLMRMPPTVDASNLPSPQESASPPMRTVSPAASPVPAHPPLMGLSASASGEHRVQHEHSGSCGLPIPGYGVVWRHTVPHNAYDLVSGAAGRLCNLFTVEFPPCPVVAGTVFVDANKRRHQIGLSNGETIPIPCAMPEEKMRKLYDAMRSRAVDNHVGQADGREVRLVNREDSSDDDDNDTFLFAHADEQIATFAFEAAQSVLRERLAGTGSELRIVPDRLLLFQPGDYVVMPGFHINNAHSPDKKRKDSSSSASSSSAHHHHRPSFGTLVVHIPTQADLDLAEHNDAKDDLVPDQTSSATAPGWQHDVNDPHLDDTALVFDVGATPQPRGPSCIDETPSLPERRMHGVVRLARYSRSEVTGRGPSASRVFASNFVCCASRLARMSSGGTCCSASGAPGQVPMHFAAWNHEVTPASTRALSWKLAVTYKIYRPETCPLSPRLTKHLAAAADPLLRTLLAFVEAFGDLAQRASPAQSFPSTPAGPTPILFGVLLRQSYGEKPRSPACGAVPAASLHGIDAVVWQYLSHRRQCHLLPAVFEARVDRPSGGDVTLPVEERFVFDASSLGPDELCAVGGKLARATEKEVVERDSVPESVRRLAQQLPLVKTFVWVPVGRAAPILQTPAPKGAPPMTPTASFEASASQDEGLKTWWYRRSAILVTAGAPSPAATPALHQNG